MRKHRDQITKELVKYTIANVDTTPEQVRDVVGFSFGYLDKVMKAGALESVCFPFFGKFVARLKQIHYRDRNKAMPKKVRNTL